MIHAFPPLDRTFVSPKFQAVWERLPLVLSSGERIFVSLRQAIQSTS